MGSILTAPVVTSSVTVGRMESSEARLPIMVGTRAVIAMRGADLLTNGDDQIVIVDGIGTATLTTTTLGTPGLAFEAPSLPVAIDATALAIHGAGADFTIGSADDTFLIVTGIGTVPVLTTILVPTTVHAARMGRIVRVGPTTVAMLACGPDTLPGTADDQILVVQNAVTVPAGVIVAAVGPMATDADSEPLATGGDALLIPRKGPYLHGFTTDYQVTPATALPTPPPPAPPARRGQPGPGPTAGSPCSPPLPCASPPVPTLPSAPPTTPSSAPLPSPSRRQRHLRDRRRFLHSHPRSSSTSVALAGEGADALAGTTDDLCLEVTGTARHRRAQPNAIGSFKIIGGPFVPVTGDSVRGTDCRSGWKRRNPRRSSRVCPVP